MTIETVGSFLPAETLSEARCEFERGAIDGLQLRELEDQAVRSIVERQIECRLPYVTSGELRRKHWANDFWFGLNGLECERVDSGHLYQPVESNTDLLRQTGPISYNAQHPFFQDFRFLHEAVAGRAKCRQTVPSPANLLLEIYNLSEWNTETMLTHGESLIEEIASAYRQTALRLHELGCESLQYDDTALGLMCDDNYTKRLLQGGVDLLQLHGQLIRVINRSLENLPTGLEKSIYISGGDKIVPEWEYIEYPDNIMPKALSGLNVDKFFLPFELEKEYPLKVLRHIPEGKIVVLGLADAHCPLEENRDELATTVEIAARNLDYKCLEMSPRTGFKLTSYPERALTYEDQWRKIEELNTL